LRRNKEGIGQDEGKIRVEFLKWSEKREQGRKDYAKIGIRLRWMKRKLGRGVTKVKMRNQLGCDEIQ